MIKRPRSLGAIAVAAAIMGVASASAAPGDTTWVYLRAPLPGAPASCPTAQPAGEGLVKVSLFDDKAISCPVAAVEGEPIALEELSGALAITHEQRAGAAQAGKQDATAVVNRLVDVRLVLLEARTMGIDELPEVKEAIDGIKARTSLEMLQAQATKSVKPDPAEVDRLFKDAVREWKLQSVLFVKEVDAKAMQKRLAQGGSFDALAKEAVAARQAKGGDVGDFVPTDKIVLPVQGAIAKLKQGQVSASIKLAEGWAIVRVDAIRYPENAQARATAEQVSLGTQRKIALKKYYGGLEKKYVKIDEPLLKKLNYEAKEPGLAALKKDTRVVARVEGSPPVTVGDLTSRLEQQYFHGAEQQVVAKKLNRAKRDTLDAILSPRIVALEADRLGIPRSEAYRRRVDAQANAYLFGVFVQRVIVPDVKLTEADAQKYYEAHKADYSYPAFYRVESIGFGKARDAEAAVAKLRSGTDFKWLNANADGKLPEGEVKEKVSGVLSGKSLSPDMAKALEGAKSGDYRVLPAADNRFYAVHVIEVIPPSAQPYAEVREGIAEKLYGEGLNKAVLDYMAKLRKAHPVQVYLTRVGS